MPTDTDDIERIAPTPWAKWPGSCAEIQDVQGKSVCLCTGKIPEPVRDRIIVRVNACAGLNPRVVPDLVTTVKDLRAAILDAAYTTERCQRALARSEAVLAQAWPEAPDPKPQEPDANAP